MDQKVEGQAVALAALVVTVNDPKGQWQPQGTATMSPPPKATFLFPQTTKMYLLSCFSLF